MEQTSYIYHIGFLVIAINDIERAHYEFSHGIAMLVAHRNRNVARTSSGNSFKKVERTKNSLNHMIRFYFEKIALEAF